MSEDRPFKERHGLTLYNSMSRSRQAFVPLDASRVRLYVCGPTVYDQPHIGNGRSVVAFDVLFRVLRHIYGADHVVYVRNITDVDDKIIARAEQDFAGTPLNEAIGRLTRTTAEGFRRDVAALGCLVPSFEPLATDHIEGMVAMVADLIRSGHAYVSEGHVLFDVSSMPAYGELSGKKLEDLIAGARVAVEAYKRQPADFVLWKPSTDQQPGWESPWGTGRPGWHLECSAMAKALLGETFDIHGGGLDLIFPHHENEIAQSRCANDTKTMANVWMHNGFLQLEGSKMSKSEGNFVTIDDLLHSDSFGGRPWPGAVLRLALLSTHYRQPIDFTLGKLREAEHALRKFVRLLGNDRQPPRREGDETLSPALRDALLDDLNTPAAIAELHGLAALVAQGDESAGDQLSAGLDLLGFADIDEALFDPVLELSQSDETRIDEQIALRQGHIAGKNWAEADAIRDRLLEEGIQLMDGKNPETGERTTRWEKVQ